MVLGISAKGRYCNRQLPVPWFCRTNHSTVHIKPQYYTVEEGRLYAGEYPGALAPEVAYARLQHLVDLGIRTFVDLTTPDDRLEPYSQTLHQLAEESGLSLRRIAMPIADMGVPRSPDVMREILDAVTLKRWSFQRSGLGDFEPDKCPAAI